MIIERHLVFMTTANPNLITRLLERSRRKNERRVLITSSIRRFIRLLLIRVCEDKAASSLNRFISDGGPQNWQRRLNATISLCQMKSIPTPEIAKKMQ